MVGGTEELRLTQTMRQPLFGDKRRITMQVLFLLLTCALTIVGLHYVAEQGRTTFYYLGGNVVSAGESSFCITVIPEESNVDPPLSTDVYCFEMKDFQSKSPIPKIGDTVRITCNHDMTILIGVYNVDDLPN